ncbi:MAG: glycosyltransferase family 4 protein [Hyphococcus sp.]
MKILYSHRTRAADGQSVHIRELTDALARRGHEIVMARPSAAAVASEPVSARLKSLLPSALYELAEAGYSAPAYLRLSRLAKNARPDVLYERYNLFYHAGAWVKAQRGLPMMLEVNAPLAAERASHGQLRLKDMARASERTIWRAADRVLPVSQALAEHVAAAGVPEEKIDVIHNGVSAAFLARQDGGAVRRRFGLTDETVLGFAGFVRAWHGVDRVVRFLARAPQKHVRLLIVGDGPARKDIHALARDLGVEDKVIFTGAVPHDALPAHIAAFDIALQPAATAYASPLKLFEYMALGKAIIAPDQANIREIVTDGEDAMLFTASDEKALHEALAGLVENCDARARLGACARAALDRRDYTWDGNAQRVERIAESILKDRS